MALTSDDDVSTAVCDFRPLMEMLPDEDWLGLMVQVGIPLDANGDKR